MSGTVLNVRDGRPDGAVYVGRPSAWGNPFAITPARTRRDVVSMFRRYAEAKVREEPGWLAPLVGRDLLCWCAPLECHGDVLLELIEGAAAPAEAREEGPDVRD